jgi:hypothetical protein
MSEFFCPACGYPALEEAPRSSSGGGSFEICPCCGFQFGVTDDDRRFTYDEWRERWIAAGMPWRDEGIQPPPPGWDPRKQLQRLASSNDTKS